jgi:hypothetical protein
MANNNQNRNDQPDRYNKDWKQNQNKSGQDENNDRENYEKYENTGFENEYYTGIRKGNYENRNTNEDDRNSGYDRRYDNEGRRYDDMRNVDYGSVYHGNVERREWETNQAGGGRYNRNKGMRNTGFYNSDYQNSNYEDRYGNRNYPQSNDRNWWNHNYDDDSSWPGDEDIESRRYSEERTTGIHKGKGPRGYTRSDERITEDICDRLTDDGYIDASDIEVKVEGSEVILSGTVNSREEKRRAEDLVESTSGVRQVENRIKVKPGRASTNTDQDTSGRHNQGQKIKSDFGSDYTGTADNATGIGKASGTTNEIIRDVNKTDEIR